MQNLDFEKIFRAFLEEHQKREEDILIERITKVSTAVFNAASIYTNIVIFAGYASFFTLLSLLRDKMPHNLVLWAAALMAISITAFVFFEIYKMLLIAFRFFKQQKALALEGDKMAGIKAYEKAAQTGAKTFMRVWIFVLLICIPTALGGLGIVAYAFILELIRV